jgi:hypothetical protein
MKNMKWIVSLVLCFSLFSAFAQPEGEMDDNRKEKIERLKRMYIGEKLDLSVSEAEKFWPIYNEFSAKRDAIRKSVRQAQKKMKAGAQSEKEAIETIDSMTMKKKEEADLDAKFLKDCLPVLGVEKVMRLAQLPKEFQQELVRKMKERREMNRENGQPGRRRY